MKTLGPQVGEKVPDFSLPDVKPLDVERVKRQ